MKKPLRREKAAVAIAALLELAESREDEGVTPFEELDPEEQEYAKDIAANLINLVDALRGEV